MDWAIIWGISVTIALICMCIYTMSLHEAISSIYNLLERIIDSVYNLAQIILEEEDKK